MQALLFSQVWFQDLIREGFLMTLFSQPTHPHLKMSNVEYVEAVVRRCSVKKVSLEISQNSLESTCATVSF